MLNDSGCKDSTNKATKDFWKSQHSFLLSYSSAQLTVDIGVRQSSNAEPLENCIVFIPIHSSNKKTFNHSHKTEVLKLLRYITKMKFQTSCLFRLKIECKFFRRALEKEDAQPTQPLKPHMRPWLPTTPLLPQDTSWTACWSLPTRARLQPVQKMYSVPQILGSVSPAHTPTILWEVSWCKAWSTYLYCHLQARNLTKFK